MSIEIAEFVAGDGWMEKVSPIKPRHFVFLSPMQLTSTPCRAVRELGKRLPFDAHLHYMYVERE